MAIEVSARSRAALQAAETLRARGPAGARNWTLQELRDALAAIAGVLYIVVEQVDDNASVGKVEAIVASRDVLGHIIDRLNG